MRDDLPPPPTAGLLTTRGYQQEMLEESIQNNTIIALDTGSGKTHIAVLRIKHECERQTDKLSWFLAPTVSLCKQQRNVIDAALPVSVGLISGADEPNQWKDASLWRTVLSTHRVMVTTPQVLLDALRHAYVDLGRDISLLIFDEAHHAVDNNPYNQIMKEFYFRIPDGPVNETDPSNPQSARPKILGLTASPVYGGNVEAAFRNLESNLDCTIRAPRVHRHELASFVHRPRFRHVLYMPPDPLKPPYSRNLAALDSLMATLNIEDDPYVKSLRKQLKNLAPGAERTRLDQKLSMTILKNSSYTHKGLADFARAATEICEDVGPWAADWYVEKVLQQAKAAAGPHQHFLNAWKGREKAYLLGLLDQIDISPVSYDPQDIVMGTSAKVQALVDCLNAEKADAESHDEAYSGIIFVTRRDTVLALAEVIAHHPRTADHFDVGCLLGASESAYRQTFLDITRKLSPQSHEDTLEDFRLGEKNLIVSTSVAEEGIDIQACGSVIRWNIPANMVSWAQSRGRARRRRSTFTVMFEEGGAHEKEVLRWEALEQEMVDLYNNDARPVNEPISHMAQPFDDDDDDDDDENIEFRVESTGALLTLQSAIPHLNHFCSIIPNSSLIPYSPIYDIDPPDLPEGWHSFHNRSQAAIPLYQGPFGSTVTLPRSLPPHLWVFSTERKYKTKTSAHQHVALKAYLALYENGLLNDHLLPLTDDMKPHLDEEVKEILKDIDKRAGMAGIFCQMDPWAPIEGPSVWRSSELAIDGLPILLMFTLSRPIPLRKEDGPTLYRSERDPLKVEWHPREDIVPTNDVLEQARHYTRRLFWNLNESLGGWDYTDFAHLFLPTVDLGKSVWDERRAWLAELNLQSGRSNANPIMANAAKFGSQFAYPTDLSLISGGPRSAKSSNFLRWEFNPISSEVEMQLRKTYARYLDLEITPPLLAVRAVPRRNNFLIPTPPPSLPLLEKPEVLLIPSLSTVALLTKMDAEYASLLPSITRFLSMAITTESLREDLLANTPLCTLSLDLLMTAITAPVSSEHRNYQRLETLGDTVLKFIVGVQLLAEYPGWHEGYLSRKKDHCVSNVRLAKEALSKGLYRWIIRDRLILKKWKPAYRSTPEVEKTTDESESPPSKKKSKKKQGLSTKVLADVVEALIGASYLHGSFELGIECAQLFGLGVPWKPLPLRIDTMLARVHHSGYLPSQITNVEKMLNYEFKHKLLLVEALTHASHQQAIDTRSYERMEFLGDSVLDMVVTDVLYHAPGKKYSPGHIHLRKSAVVNQHFLAFICLRCAISVEAAMPRRGERGSFALSDDTQQVYLWQCLLHSSLPILDDQNNTFARYKKGRADIEAALHTDSIFPWAALTRLQAPKFFSDLVESVIGAVYLDSGGDFGTVNRVLRVLGILQVLEHIIADDVDVLHPVSRLSLWAQKQDKEVKYHFEKEKGKITCIISVDGQEEIRIGELYRGRASRDEVKFMAAEQVIKKLKLRTGTAISRKKKKNPTN